MPSRHSIPIALLALLIPAGVRLRPWRRRNPAAPAAASATMKNRCPARARRDPQGPRGAASPRRTNRAAHRERAVAAAATISMAPGWSMRRRRHLSGHQQQRRRRHQRQDHRSDRARHRQSRWHGVRHLDRQWHHGHHDRPPVRPQRRRNVPAIGRLHRKVDGSQAIASLQRIVTQILEAIHDATLHGSTYDQDCPLLSLLISAAPA